MIQVIGLGNELRGDDGIGPRIIEELEKSSYRDQMHLINAAADAFIVLEYLKENNPVIIIDCARMGREAGGVIIFDADEAHAELMDTLISLHGFGLAEIYRIAAALGPVAPTKIIGVEPKSIDFNTGLSVEVEKSIPKIINLVIEEIKKNV
jgi:hydrogenase maturation protease